MKIEFQFIYTDINEQNLINDFCESLISSIKHDALNGIKYFKFDNREKYLINASWITWINKPTTLNMSWVVNYIINNISYKVLKDNIYIIYIKGTLPNSKTKLDTIARFLDKGNEKIPPTHFLSPILLKYKQNLNNYWKSFVQNKLRRIEVNECIRIR